MLTACSANTGWLPTATGGVITNEAMSTPVASCSPMLSWLGGICTLCGMALLMLSGGKMGWKPLIGGILFIVINYALALYANWIFLPVVIATGAISLAWAGKIVWKIVNDDDIKIKEIF
tara:strand:+ start:204 stop:560 length:357 start_codon:yes stop_codon:yes gene_type:complete